MWKYRLRYFQYTVQRNDVASVEGFCTGYCSGACVVGGRHRHGGDSFSKFPEILWKVVL